MQSSRSTEGDLRLQVECPATNQRGSSHSSEAPRAAGIKKSMLPPRRFRSAETASNPLAVGANPVRRSRLKGGEVGVAGGKQQTPRAEELPSGRLLTTAHLQRPSFIIASESAHSFRGIGLPYSLVLNPLERLAPPLGIFRQQGVLNRLAIAAQIDGIENGQ
jgi:hypothetical protein